MGVNKGRRGFGRFGRWFLQYPDRSELDLHPGVCWRPWLVIIRSIGFGMTTLRLMWELIWREEFDTLMLVRYFSWVGFMLTWLYYTLWLEDVVLNRCCCKLSLNLRYYVCLFYELSLPSQIIVNVIYWAAIYDYGDSVKAGPFILNITLHGMPLLLLLMELPCNAMAFPIRHVLLSVIIGVIYVITNWAYTRHVTKVYSFIDWSELKSFLVMFGSILVVVGLHLLFKGLYSCKNTRKVPDDQFIYQEGLDSSENFQTKKRHRRKHNSGNR